MTFNHVSLTIILSNKASLQLNYIKKWDAKSAKTYVIKLKLSLFLNLRRLWSTWFVMSIMTNVISRDQQKKWLSKGRSSFQYLLWSIIVASHYICPISSRTKLTRIVRGRRRKHLLRSKDQRKNMHKIQARFQSPQVPRANNN